MSGWYWVKTSVETSDSRDEQAQPAGEYREDGERRDRECDGGTLALRLQPAGEHRRRRADGAAAQQWVQPALRREHERGPEADEEERGRRIDVGDRSDQATVDVEREGVVAETDVRGVGNSTRAKHSYDEGERQKPTRSGGKNPALRDEDKPI